MYGIRKMPEYMNNNPVYAMEIKEIKRTRPTKRKLIQAFEEFKDGRSWEDICKEMEIYWDSNSKYNGMVIADIKRLKELEVENARLRDMYVSLSLAYTELKNKTGIALEMGFES
ncbi:hypothetical protein [Taibaiella chishuiensis]|uniref:Transposase n=1 Tax=Taibaiella chishuiensis TaxID=1434707 RepID=A0A2P8D7S8_9BACT|nr:hypothetical protein [Taibaiella chishuiensis]PSK93257.1 hypothetical protein B0I18_102227 [Taibaiella chishuiensis]